ncbi:unnamed protein product [Ambrosiozyma monospora]|uniref:Unnamed protein product n=1 Tax=Ambrosiozyma monospora TaxID=43982 RepID=A0A9W6Z3L8_AMBMO|nr:unnamed protein product [Ambrosiozyma monospora]
MVTDYLGKSFDWKPYGDIVYKNLVEPKMEHFADENLQGPSSLTKLMTSLWSDEHLHFFLYYNDYQPVNVLLSILSNKNAKDTILVSILNFVLSLLENSNDSEEFVNVMAIIISTCLDSLVLLLENSVNVEVNSKAVQILLTFVEREFITENESRKILISSLTTALDKPSSQMSIKVKADVVKIIAAVVRDYDCSLSDILPLYKSVSKLYQIYPERNIRIVVSMVFLSLAERFEEFAKVAPIVDDLNAYSKKRIQEPDFERRLSAFSLVNRQEYPNLTLVEWMPIIYSALYFINDENDQSMRSSASYTLIRYVDCLNSKDAEETAAEYVEFLRLVVLDNVRLGLRKKNELVQNEYISVFSHIIESAKYFHDLDDLKVLLYNGNEEADFFKNVNHPQVHRRQRAIKRLSEHGSELGGAKMLPMKP